MTEQIKLLFPFLFLAQKFFVDAIVNIRPRAGAAKALTFACVTRTTVFASPRAFHSPWFLMSGAIFQTSGWFRRRRHGSY